ncbi:tetratricopeptide repeat protein [Candidatus Peregrinibacteria bacterium]|nr:tetratricopeptide repeat protein [Candidatus Peregrinibacteria bacterium]
MNKKILTFLWLIIAGGSIFIFSHYYKPKAEKETSLPVISTATELQTKTATETLEIENKTYTNSINQGDKFLNNGDIKNAIIHYKNAVRLNPQSAEPLNRLGEAYILNNEPKEAEEIFTQSLKFSPPENFTNLKLRIIQSKLDQRQIEQAKALLTELDAKNLEVKYYNGLLEILYKNFDKSKEIFEEIAKTEEPKDKILEENVQKFLKNYQVFSYYQEGEKIFLETMLAKSFTDTGQYQAAIPLLFDVINQKNNYADAWLILGYSYLNINKIPDAIDALTKAQNLNDQKSEIFFFLGLAYFANNDLDQAIASIKKADELGFEPKEQIKLKLGDMYLLKEDYKNAEKLYDELISLNTDNIDLFVRNAWLNIDKLKSPFKAVDVAFKAVENHPDNAMSYNLVGWALTANGNYDEAKGYFQKALTMNPRLDAAYLNFGWLYEKQGAEILAKEYYKKAFEIGSGNSVANLAAIRYNNLSKPELKSYYSKVNISEP